MVSPLPHATWFKEASKKLKSSDGKSITVYEFVVDFSDEPRLKSWAKLFREHYFLDEKIDRNRRGTGKTRSQFLLDSVFPDKTADFGPATRSGDFAEILISDLLESQFGYWVPRVRYSNKMVRNESPKGTDVMGFKLAEGSPLVPSNTDSLMAIESKAQMSGLHPKAKLQEAVEHSGKDAWRVGEALFAIKRRLLDDQKENEADVVERFQDGCTVPYLRKSGAAAVLNTSVFQIPDVEATDCSLHENVNNLKLVVVHASEFMKLVHAMYERAANEA